MKDQEPFELGCASALRAVDDDASQPPAPRAVLRGIILATLRSVPTGRWNAKEIADALLDQFEVEMEHWLIGVVPGPAGDVALCEQIRMPDRQPVTHWRYVLRSAPVPAAKRLPEGDPSNDLQTAAEEK